MMIKLSEECYIAANQVTKVCIDSYERIMVHLQDGTSHCYTPNDRIDLYSAIRHLIGMIEDALGS